MTLTAPERERLRREVDRRKRQRIGARLSREDAWVTIPEASGLVGVKATELRLRVRQLRLDTSRRSGATVIALADLDRLR
jgi:hypothetical protein